MNPKISSRLQSENKFSFTLDFQLEVMRYLVQEQEAFEIVSKVKPGYFGLIEYSIIMEAVRKFSKKWHRTPTKVLLREQVTQLLNQKNYKDLVLKEDIPNLNKMIDNLYDTPVKDSDVIADQVYKFIAYVEMKALNESMDFSDFSQYESYQSKISKIIKQSTPSQKQDEPLYMVQGTIQRQMRRKTDPDVIPTPYWQLNQLSNGNGYTQGSIFVLLDKPKARKTFALINIARGYLTMKKNVLYVDLENGKHQIMERMVQSTLNKTRLDLLSGDYDKIEARHMRKYKRLGVEFIVERLPAMVSDANTIRALIQNIEAERDIKINILMIDYAAKLASIDRDHDEVERISNVYIDLDNLAVELELDAIWTAQHVKRDAAAHKETRYEDNDIASAISIVRNAQCILGLNSTEEEEQNNIQRLEVVVQRDGKPKGRCLFNTDLDKQRWREFSKEARSAYDNTQGQIIDELLAETTKKKKLPKNADPVKRAKTTGDI